MSKRKSGNSGTSAFGLQHFADIGFGKKSITLVV